ncbi:uncharacterized protein Dwil_GK18561 [Drosophila willistoni]|uniref:Uncharacterized protein n=1 Tax=Drosophila willistoni TaxID=7260 RepID=A0A0Q9X6G0_DROWI|nr:uncharacterized protein Dwil_GK18561 [Drosophila willistoni]
MSKVEDETEIEQYRNLQQQLETAAVLMDISKKIVISPPCSNPQSPCLTTVKDSSIKSSVIKKKRPTNDNELQGLVEIDLSIKKHKMEYFKQRNSIPIHRPCQNPIIENQISCLNRGSDVNNHSITITDMLPSNCKIKLKSNTNAENAFCCHTDSGDSSDSNKLEMDIAPTINDRQSPDSLSSDHATDAATTQLWQALARSAAKNNEQIPTTQIIRTMMSQPFFSPVSSTVSFAKVPDEPIALLKDLSDAQYSKAKACRRKQSFPTKTDCCETTTSKITDRCQRKECTSNIMLDTLKDKKCGKDLGKQSVETMMGTTRLFRKNSNFHNSRHDIDETVEKLPRDNCEAACACTPPRKSTQRIARQWDMLACSDEDTNTRWDKRSSQEKAKEFATHLAKTFTPFSIC